MCDTFDNYRQLGYRFEPGHITPGHSWVSYGIARLRRICDARKLLHILKAARHKKT